MIAHFGGCLALVATLGAAFSPGAPARTLTTKMNPLPPNAWTTIAALPPGNAGIITQLQIWTAGPMPAEVLFRGSFDGAQSPQMGTNGTSVGTPALTVALDVLLSSAWVDSPGYTGPMTWFTPALGCNYLDASGVGGHIRMDMPYADGFSLELYNAGASGNYWVMVTYVPLAVAPSPLRLFIQPFCVTNLASGNDTYPEVSLLGVNAGAPNGVFFKGLKFFAEAPTTGISWAEGKFRFYTGGPGFPTSSVQEYRATSPNDLSYYNQLPNVTQLGSSSGAEDYFMSGFDWRGGPCYAHDLAGTVHCDFYSPTLSRVAAYRLYTDDVFAAPPDTPFVATFTVNDQNFAVPSAVNSILGVTFYYA